MGRLLKISEVSKQVSVTGTHLYRLIKSGQLSAVRIGKRGLRIEETEIERFLASRGRSNEGP